MRENGTEGAPVMVDVFEMRFLGRSLKRHGWLVVLCAVLAGLIGGLWAAFSPRVYRAEAVLLVNIQAVRIGADGIPLDVELVPPARRTVGTICQSDAVMTILAARLAGKPDPAWPSEDELAEMISDEGYKSARTREVREQFEQLYFDQRSQEEAGLRAVAQDPAEAAHLANSWAKICCEMLVRAYGTTQKDIEEIEAEIERAKAEVLAKRAALTELEPGTAQPQRLEREIALDKAEQYLKALTERYGQLKVRQRDSRTIARIISPAAPPTEPINASTGLVASLFTLGGALLGLGLSLLRGFQPT